MSTTELRNEQWSKILEFLRSCPDLYVGEEDDCRRYVEAILWMARSGAPWRLLPEHYGHWNSVYKRFARWCEKGVWERMHQHFVQDPDMEHVIIDSTVIAVAPDREHKIKPPELTAGQRHDITQAQALIADFETEHVIADKGYDSMDFLQCILGRGALPVIPPRSNRKTPREYDEYLYRERHLVECFINKIKHYRHIFSRFDKLSSRFLGFLNFVGALIWLR